ncbi:hypothetical protein CR513_14250, partial [Mucuna pruriens]
MATTREELYESRKKRIAKANGSNRWARVTGVIYQLREEWETRDPKLIPYHSHVTAMAEQFDEISFHYVPRDENQMANAIATLSSMLQAN